MRRRWWTILIVVVLGGFLALLFLSPREPSYEGKTLSYWLQASELNTNRSKTGEAIVAMGVDAIPFLKLKLRSAPHRLRFELESRLRDLLHNPFPPNSPIFADHDYQQAFFAFKSLGATGVPTLVGLLDDYDPEVQWRAADLLGEAGEKSKGAIPRLLKILAASKIPRNRQVAAKTLGRIGSNIEITQALTTALGDSEPEVRVYAALGLGRYDFLKTPFGQTMKLYSGGWNGQEAVGSGGIHSSATNALPQLNQKLQDKNKMVRAAAKFAIDQIQGTNAVVTLKDEI